MMRRIRRYGRVVRAFLLYPRSVLCIFRHGEVGEAVYSEERPEHLGYHCFRCRQEFTATELQVKGARNVTAYRRNP